MFYYLSKALPPLVYPLGLAVLLLVASLFLRRWPRWQTALTMVAILVLWLGGNRLVAMTVVRSLEWQYEPPAVLPQAEVIVVLGGGVYPPGPPRPMTEMNEAGDRLTYAAKLYQDGVAPYLLLSGGGVTVDGQRLRPEAENMADLLVLMGVPREALWLETASRNTYENAVESKRILEPKGIDRIVLVTSALHMPRSAAIYAKQGFDGNPGAHRLPGDQRLTGPSTRRPTCRFNSTTWRPAPSTWKILTDAVKEYIGWLVYRVRGWL